jgi:hypothetical protein
MDAGEPVTANVTASDGDNIVINDVSIDTEPGHSEIQLPVLLIGSSADRYMDVRVMVSFPLA